MKSRLFTFIQNEAYMLKRWIPYHAAIFGIENIFIIDHRSDEKKCLQLLESYRQKGLHVLQTDQDYRKKSKILTALMHKQKSGADLLIPVDADEFICLKDGNNNMIADPAQIQSALKQVPLNGKKYAFNIYTAVNHKTDYEDPLLEMNRFTFFKGKKKFEGIIQSNPNLTKSFFPSFNFAFTDQGNHLGGVLLASDREFNQSDLCLAHFHLCGYSHFIKKLEQKSEAYSMHNLQPDYKGPGMRWNRWFHEIKSLSENEQRDWYRKKFISGEGEVQNAFRNYLMEMEY